MQELSNASEVEFAPIRNGVTEAPTKKFAPEELARDYFGALAGMRIVVEPVDKNKMISDTKWSVKINLGASGTRVFTYDTSSFMLTDNNGHYLATGSTFSRLFQKDKQP